MEDRHKVGSTETPVPEAQLLGVGHTMAQHPKEDLDAGAVVKMANGEVKSGQQVYKEGLSQAHGMKVQESQLIRSLSTHTLSVLHLFMMYSPSTGRLHP